MRHTDEVLRLLLKQIGNQDEVDEIRVAAAKVSQQWVAPLSGGVESTNGLIYGLVQSGKTGVLSVTAAMGVDEGYSTLVILTSDIDPLYNQTLRRVREALPGVDVLGKADFSNRDAFLQRIKGGRCAIVTTKNARRLQGIIEHLLAGRLKGLSCLIIDDEADQASLNTRASRNNGSQSAINAAIITLRGFFEKNTYLQVTATPQALFLQESGHQFRPVFTVLSNPGADYVGSDDFFGDASPLIREFPIADIGALSPGNQPSPVLRLPTSLLEALDTFMVGATFKRRAEPDQNCAFLCHVSTRTGDHVHIEALLRKYKSDLAESIAVQDPALIARLKRAYDALSGTHPGFAEVKFEEILDAVEFYSPGIAVKLVNGESDDDVAVDSPYNLFVGGNKLGRGVTIKNLLVSYYGRNPRQPQADTVLQHARMYGYRRRDIGLLRLYLPPELLVVFRAIARMEKELRTLIGRSPGEEFRGVYVEGALRATRRNVLVPGAVGVYSAGAIYNPAQVVRRPPNAKSTVAIDEIVRSIENKSHRTVPLEDVLRVLDLIEPDETKSEMVWNSVAVRESLEKLAGITKQRQAFIYVDRDRELRGPRRETAGILSGGEAPSVPDTLPTLFLLRVNGADSSVAWWPQMRFPSGRYAFAFAL